MPRGVRRGERSEEEGRRHGTMLDDDVFGSVSGAIDATHNNEDRRERKTRGESKKLRKKDAESL